MGGFAKSETSESLKFVNEGFEKGGKSVKFFLMIGLALSLTACQSKSKKTELPAEVDYLQSKDASVILSQGYNRSAVFSSDGDKIYYISKNRRGHQNSQIHEYDLTLQSDRRITFQDGEIFSVVPGEGDQIIYASNTDEIKEEPFAREQDSRYLKADLYSSDLYGNEIARLTQSPGYEGDMIFVPQKKQVLFTSMRSGVPGLYWLNLSTGRTTSFVVDKERAVRSPVLSPDGKNFFWVQEDPKDKTQSIITSPWPGKGSKIVKTLKGQIKNLAIKSTGQVVYSWQPDGSDLSQIDIYDADKACTQTLLKSKLNFSEPQFSVNNPNLMIFRVANNDKSQIYRWQIPVDLGPCNEQPPSDTLKK
jgi:Tol biopolymer transport system component